MDILSIKPAERVIEITHPGTGENIGLRISILSLEDEKLAKIRRRILDQRLQLEAKGKTFKVENLENNSMTLLLAAITGWEWYGDIDFNGEKPDFTLVNVRKVLEDVAFIRAQVDQEIGKTEDFFIS